MATRVLNKLSARSIAAAKAPGRYGDGGGLYLVVSPSGSRKWVFRFVGGGKQRDMGLGPAHQVGVVEARSAAGQAREHVRAGRDPIAEREIGRRLGKAVPTFGEVSDQLFESIEAGFKNAKHRAQWKMTLTVYAKPIRHKPVDTITTDDVLSVLGPLWQTVPETAGRLRGRIERILDAAKAKDLRAGENPARWRGHLDALLPKRRKLTRGHHAALPFIEVPAFMTSLRSQPGLAAISLEFTILTAGRTNEVLGMRQREVDFNANVWTVPAERMKAGIEHRVPLSQRAIEILKALISDDATKQDAFVFPGAKNGRPQSEMALAMVLRRMEVPVTVHGFRSTFRDWAGDCTTFPREIAEAALAHVVGDETELAYRRGDALEKRRALMKAWADYCERPEAQVISLAGSRPGAV